MAYEPLHHKYRPQTFAELVGQNVIATTLTNAIRTAKIAPAYLFTGPRGTGKTSSARILAKSLNCLSSKVPTEKPCGVCAVCQGIANGSALDVIEIDAASNTGVDNIRELIERAQFAPVQCRYKVYVIDECLTGDSLVQTSEGLIRIDNPNIKGKKVLSYNDSSGAWEFKKVVRWLDQGEHQTLVIKTTNREIRCTGNHLIRTETGWIQAKDITKGMKILSPVNVDAAPSFTSGVAMDASQKRHRAGMLFSPWLNHFAPTVPVGVEKSLISPHLCSEREKELGAFSSTGKNVPTRDIILGTQKPMSVWSIRRLCNQTHWDSSTELCLEILPLSTQTNTVAFPDCIGDMGNNRKNGQNTKAIALQNCDQNLVPHLTTDTEKHWSIARHPAIPDLGMSTASLDPMKQENPSLWTGLRKLPQKDLLGGTWTMVPSASVGREVHQFDCIHKDFLWKKTKSLLIGLQDWVIQQKRCITTTKITQAKGTTTPEWTPIRPENGWQTSGSIQFHQWNTSLEIVESVQLGEVERVYDIEVQSNHNFVANGLCLHNCHMLSTAAFNALLKTLEEPPERVVFVLATTDPQRVLPTIISRCQRFDFRRIAIEAMVAHLRAIASIENINITPEAVLLVAQVAQGGLRDAESLLDQLSLLSGQVTVERVWDLVGSCSEPDLMELLQAIAQNNPEALLDCARKVMDRGREPLTILQNLAGFYRDLLIAFTAPSRSDLVAVTPSTWKALCEQAVLYDIPSILAGQQHLAKSEVQLKNTTQPRLWLEVTLLGLLRSANNGQQVISLSAPSSQSGGNSVTTTTQPVAQSEVSRNRPPAQHQPPHPTAPVNVLLEGTSRNCVDFNAVANNSVSLTQSAPPAASQPLSPDQHLESSSDVSIPEPIEAVVPLPSASQPSVVDSPSQTSGEQIWQQVLANLQPISTRELLRQMGHLIEFDDPLARIGMKSQKWCDQAKDYLPNIKAAFQAIFNREVQVRLELATQTKTVSVNESSATGSTTPTSPQIAKQGTSHFAATSTQTKALTEFQPPSSAENSTAPISASPPLDVATSTPKNAAELQDEVLIAAQRCADFFNGELVEINLDLAFPQSAINSSSPPTATPAPELSDFDAEDADIEF